MSGQKYKRTNFEEDEASAAGTPPATDITPSVLFKSSVNMFKRKRTGLECVLFIILGGAMITIIVLASLVAVKEKKIENLHTPALGLDTGPCLSPKCVTVASALLNAMDQTVDPCQDFYQYACGGWINTHVIPAGHSQWSNFGLMGQENQVIMKKVIERTNNASRSESEKKAKMFYDSCMDKNKTIEDRGAKPLLDFMRKLGGWAISNTTGYWDPNTFNFQETVGKTKVYGVLFSLYVREDDKNSSRNILQIDQGGLGLPSQDHYLNKSIDDDPLLHAYWDYMTANGVLLGGSENETRDMMREVIEFETAIANITIPSEDRRDEEDIYHKMTIADLQNRAPFIDWLLLINKMVAVAKLSMKATDEIVVYVPEFLDSLTLLLREVQQQDNGNRTLNNYMTWQVVRALTPYLSKPFREARRDYAESITGTTGGEELWRYCISETDKVLGFALGSMFVREVFKGDNKQKAEVMIEEVKSAFKNNLPNLAWMDAETRAAAVDKANAVIDMIGFPEYILNATLLDAEYQGLKINASEYFENNLRILYFELKENMEQLNKTPKANVWDMTPPTVNAYYTPTKNEIVFPAGILQAPFYDRDFPKSLNFGAMGVVMGHELTHGFDDQGREYDKMGNLRPWWNNASISRFKEKTQCMIDQYSKYTINGQNVRGKQTLGENIADNGGLKAAFHAYENWVENHREEIPLPGIHLTHRQLFFLGFAQVWCSTSTEKADQLQIVEDQHSPAKFRVIGTLSNSVEFSQLFKCPRNSPMNPEKKCIIW